MFGRRKQLPPEGLEEDRRTEMVLDRMEAVTGRMEDVVALLERRLVRDEEHGDKDR